MYAEFPGKEGQAYAEDAMDRWARVKAIFLETVDLSDQERATVVARHCGADADLRVQVEALLASDRRAGAFCDTPAAALLGASAFRSRTLTAGSTVGPYLVESFIGAGGMGEVYRAIDTRDGSHLALKTVGDPSLDPLAARRLVREAQHAKALSHPGICGIRGIDVIDGVPYIAMDLIDGRTLAEIQKQDRIPVDSAVDCAIDLADALAHAHGRGVVHRDLTASNVMIDRSGRPIILDFGLAKRLNRADERPSSGSMILTSDQPAGTLSYMPPEVLLGRPADARSDIWSLGVILHQLLTGTLPFTGRTAFQTSAAILADDPRSTAPSPLALRLVVERCLAKDPCRRYQRAGDLHRALKAIRAKRGWRVAAQLLLTDRRRRRLAAAAVLVLSASVAGALAWTQTRPPVISSVGIAPFEGPPGDEPYAAGISENLAAQLAAASNVRVVLLHSSRASTASAGAGDGPAAVDAVLRGTVRRTEDRLALDLQLRSSSDGKAVWTRTLDRPAREVLSLQAEAARELAGHLDVGIEFDAVRRLAEVPSVSPDVYEAYLKGRYEWNQRTAGSLERAIQYFERAIELDPAYAPGHAALADCYNLLGTVMVASGSPLQYRPRAERAAIRALQIDPELAAGHAALGYVLHYSWRWTDAERAFLRAIELAPERPLPRVWYANLLMSRGRFDEALRQVYAARDVDPFSLIVNTNIGWILLNAGRAADAVSHLMSTVAMDPSYPQARWRLAGALSAEGRHQQAETQAREVLRLTGRTPASVAMYASILAQAGQTAQASRLVEEVRGHLAQGEYVSPGSLPPALTRLGEHDDALDWIERAATEQANIVAYLAVEPWTMPLRGHPRFQAVLRRAGLEVPVSR